MNKDYLMYYNDFFLKKIPFSFFKEEIKDYIENANKNEIEEFYDYTTDNSFFEYDSDMVMLTYLYLWVIDNTFKNNFPLTGSDNMFLSFIRSLFNDYDDFKDEAILTINNLNYEIYKLKDIYLIINTSDVDLSVNVPKELENTKCFCINCNDEIEIESIVDIYPYGFMLIKKN